MLDVLKILVVLTVGFGLMAAVPFFGFFIGCGLAIWFGWLLIKGQTDHG